MVVIILLPLALGIWVAKNAFAEEKRKAKKSGQTRLKASSVGFIVIVSVVYLIVGGMVGFLISIGLPTPPLPVEEKIVVETLLPFTKKNETDPVVYTIPVSINSIKDNAHVRVRYNDGTSVKVAICCGDQIPKIIETQENHASIKRYHTPSYLGWFSIRSGKTWYEIHVPRNIAVPEDSMPLEILR